MFLAVQASDFWGSYWIGRWGKALQDGETGDNDEYVGVYASSFFLAACLGVVRSFLVVEICVETANVLHAAMFDGLIR